MVVEKQTHPSFRTGAKTIGTTAARLADSIPAYHSVRVQADANNTGTVFVGDWPLGVWSYFELKVVTHSSTGSVELRVNGSAKLTLTNQNTQPGSNAYHDQVRLQGPTGVVPMFDDWYVADGSGSANNDFLGNQKVVAVYPNADGSSSDWTPSSGVDNFAMVDEAVADDDSTYCDGASIGDKDLYGFGAVSLDGIKGVQVNLDAKLTDAGALQAIIVARSGVTESDGDSEPLSASYSTLVRVIETDPATAAAWTQSGLNSAEFGVKVG